MKLLIISSFSVEFVWVVFAIFWISSDAFLAASWIICSFLVFIGLSSGSSSVPSSSFRFSSSFFPPLLHFPPLFLLLLPQYYFCQKKLFYLNWKTHGISAPVLKEYLTHRIQDIQKHRRISPMRSLKSKSKALYFWKVLHVDPRSDASWNRLKIIEWTNRPC